MVAVAAVIVSQEKLVREYGGKELSTIVVEAAMPNLVMKIEQGFEPLVKRLHRNTTPGIELLGVRFCRVCPSLLSLPAVGLSIVSLSPLPLGRLVRLKGTEEVASRGTAQGVALDEFPVEIAVITGVSQYVACATWQLTNFGRKGPMFAPVGGIDGRQQRPDGP